MEIGAARDHRLSSATLGAESRGPRDRSEEELGRWAAALSVPIFHALRDLARDEGANAGAALAKPSFAARTRTALLRFLTLLEELLDARGRLGLVRDDLGSVLTREHDQPHQAHFDEHGEEHRERQLLRQEGARRHG